MDEEDLLDLTRIDVEAPGDDHLLDPSLDPEVAVRPETPDVARSEPALGVERISGRLRVSGRTATSGSRRSEEHTSELQSQSNLVCRLLLEKKNTNTRWW